MNPEKRGFWRSSFHSFGKTLFGTFGVGLAFIPLMILFMALAGSGRDELTIPGKYLVLPNADLTREPLSAHSPVVLQINIDGIIGSEKRFGISALDLEKQLLYSREGALKGGRVKAILLSLNTPGGGAFESDAIYRALISYKKLYNVPIYAYADGMAASGGMYIAAAADKFYASPGAFVGSIGVIANFFNVHETLEKLGVKPAIASRGKGKAAMNPFRPWDEDDEAQINLLLNFSYDQFVDIVTQNRPQIDRNRLIEEYGAKLFPAPIALQNGYIDGIVWNREEALANLVEEAGIADFYQVVSFQPHRSIFDLFSSKSPVITGELSHHVELPKGLDPSILNGYLYLYHPGL